MEAEKPCLASLPGEAFPGKASRPVSPRLKAAAPEASYNAVVKKVSRQTMLRTHAPLIDRAALATSKRRPGPWRPAFNVPAFNVPAFNVNAAAACLECWRIWPFQGILPPRPAR